MLINLKNSLALVVVFILALFVGVAYKKFLDFPPFVRIDKYCASHGSKCDSNFCTTRCGPGGFGCVLSCIPRSCDDYKDNMEFYRQVCLLEKKVNYFNK